MKILMCAQIFCMLCIVKQYNSLQFIDIPSQNSHQFRSLSNDVEPNIERRPYPPVRPSEDDVPSVRRSFVVPQNFKKGGRTGYEDEKDANLKYKISTLVQQTVHDTERKVKSIEYIKEKHRDEAPYKAGFILSMIKKSRDILNELFNVAVKHKDEWKALEQLKIFELIVHTNVDTTNLVRQLVEIHIQYLNTTGMDGSAGRKRVVLLK